MVTRSIKSKLLVILGLTSTGKTDLALSLAGRFNGELIACDSRQVYKGLDIGTGKMPGNKAQIKKAYGFWEINGISVWMYDLVDLENQYTVSDYVEDANRVIEEITARGRLPIIVGGTGLYLKALLEGLPNLVIPVDEKLRLKLQKFSKEKLQEELQKLSAAKWDRMNNSDRQNPRRLIRVIEISTGRQKEIKKPYLGLSGYDISKIGLNAPKDTINRKIDARVLDWIKEGIIEEVESFLKKGISKKRIKALGLEYAVMIEFLNKTISFDQTIEKMQIKVRQYAKRQLTWFKKEKEVFWFDIGKKNYSDKVANLVRKWYYSG